MGSERSNRPGWNGEPCEARQVQVVVGNEGHFPSPWFKPFVGQTRAAVEITYGGATFYIDDEGYQNADGDQVGWPGWGWEKVMGGGSPRHGSCSLDGVEVVGV